MRSRLRFHGAMLAAAFAGLLGAAAGPAGQAIAGAPKVILAEEFGHVL
jgi:hypothetical protein